MRTPDYYGNMEKTRDKATDILDKSGLAYFLAISEKDSKNPFVSGHGKVGETHYSYELVFKAAVHALGMYDKKGQERWLKFIGKQLGYKVILEENK